MLIREQIVAKTTSLPSLPTISHELLQAVGKEDADLAEIAEVVAHDPALTANVLKAANSAYFGSRKEVSSLAEAIIKLGTKWVVQTAISSVVYSSIKKPAAGYDLSATDLWIHSYSVAMMSTTLSELLNVKNAGAIYTTALLHDMGKIALGEFVSESLEEIQSQVEESEISFEEAEKNVLGINHAEAGALVAEAWNFPQHMVQAIRWHHDPSQAEDVDSSVDIVHVADALCIMQGFGIGRDGLQYRPDEKAISRLKLSNTMVQQAVCKLISSSEELVNMFGQSSANRDNGQEVNSNGI